MSIPNCKFIYLEGNLDNFDPDVAYSYIFLNYSSLGRSKCLEICESTRPHSIYNTIIIILTTLDEAISLSRSKPVMGVSLHKEEGFDGLALPEKLEYVASMVEKFEKELELDIEIYSRDDAIPFVNKCKVTDNKSTEETLDALDAISFYANPPFRLSNQDLKRLIEGDDND